MMKKLYTGILVLLMVLTLTLPVIAQMEAPGAGEMQGVNEERPTANLSWSFYSKYVWRGYELSRNSLVMFPTMTIAYKGFAMNMWGDLDTAYKGKPGDEHTKKWWETDWTLTYSNSWKILNYTLGYIYYDTDKRNNQELFTTLGLDVLLKPTISIYREIQLPGDRWYVNLGISHNIPTVKKEILGYCGEQSLDIGGWISFMSRYGDPDAPSYRAMHDGNVWAAYNIPLNNFLSIVPSINYSFPLSHQAQKEIGHSSFTAVNDFAQGERYSGGNSSFVYGGVTLKLAF
jgi:hypothetical protein